MGRQDFSNWSDEEGMRTIFSTEKHQEASDGSWQSIVHLWRGSWKILCSAAATIVLPLVLAILINGRVKFIGYHDYPSGEKIIGIEYYPPEDYYSSDAMRDSQSQGWRFLSGHEPEWVALFCGDMDLDGKLDHPGRPEKDCVSLHLAWERLQSRFVEGTDRYAGGPSESFVVSWLKLRAIYANAEAQKEILSRPVVHLESNSQTLKNIGIYLNRLRDWEDARAEDVDIYRERIEKAKSKLVDAV